MIAAADRVCAGEVALYGEHWHEVGDSPRWTTNPTTGFVYQDRHWSEIPDDDPVAGDIKDVWDLSRFTFTVPLAQAWLATGDDRYPERWWALVESWSTANPPNVGVNWRCAQESSLRAIMWCLGVDVFAEHPASTPERLALFGHLLATTRDRVEATLDYALSQRNNHAISELCFLLALPGAPSKRLVRLLHEVMEDQFFDDGSYAQQSLVYQRLATQTLAWLLDVQPTLPAPLREPLTKVVSLSLSFLDSCADHVSGELANYGPNDGSSLFAPGRRSQLDLRPASRQASASLTRAGRDHAQASQRGSTYLRIRGERSLLVTRVGTIPRRPADADQQAIELFLDGHRVVVDPGTYRYSGQPPWRSPFVGSGAHATLRAAGATDSVGFGRFLRPPLAPACVVGRMDAADRTVVVTERSEHGVTLCRSIVRIGDCYGVIDRGVGGDFEVRWNLLGDLDLVDSRVQLPGGAVAVLSAAARTLSRSERDPLSGWWSPNYAYRADATAVVIAGRDGETIVSQFVPAGTEPLPDEEVIASCRDVLEDES